MSRHNRPYESEDNYEDYEDYEYQKNKHLYKDKAHQNEPYDRVDGEGRGVFPEHFPEESFEEFENFDEQHEWPEIGRDQEYYENYIKEIAREKDSLIEEHKILTEEYEGLLEIHNKKYDSEKKKSSPFIPEVEGKDEILDLYNQIELINYKQGLLWERFSEACQCGALDELKSKEKYWAERYERELDKIRKDEVGEKERMRKFYERGEEYIEPYETARSKRFKMSAKIEMADNGLTPDAFAELLGDIKGIIESGDGYVRAKENAEKMLDKVTYEQALESLAEGRKRGEYSDEEYYQMQVVIRRYYRV